MNLLRGFVKFFDKLEDFVRINLSHYPILYSLVGAIGIVLVWKGVWEMAEKVPGLFGFPSFALGAIILLVTGLLVSFFIGDNIILSGFRREKKLVEKTEKEIIQAEKESANLIAAEIRHMHQDIEQIKKEVAQHESRP